jgi:hypothetical protein
VRQQVKQAQADARAAAADAKTAAADAKTAAKDAQAQTPALPAPAGIPTTAPPPPPGGGFNDIPPQVVNVMSMFFVFVVALVLGTPLVRMIVRRFDRQTEGLKATGPDLTPHLRQLQESVDAMAIEIERISEGQRFTSKLLASRANASPLAERQLKD